jgi:hypothetical protein
MVAIFIRSGQQTQLAFTTERTGVVFSFDDFIFLNEPEANGDLRG